MCAFANDFHNLGGGYIVIGVAEENGRPILPPRGLDATIVDHIQKELLNLGYSAIQPAYHPVTIPYAIADLQKDGVSNSHTEPNLDSENLDLGDGRVILIIWVPGGQTRPYKVKLSLAKNEKEYGYFIRKGSSTVRAKSTDETDLLSLAATVPFDDRFNHPSRTDSQISPRCR